MSEISSAPTGAQEIGKIFSYGTEEERVQVAVNTDTNVNTVTVNEENIQVPSLPGADEDTQVLAALVDASSVLRNRKANSVFVWSGLAATAIGFTSVYIGAFAEIKSRNASNGGTMSQDTLDLYQKISNYSTPFALSYFAVGLLSMGIGVLAERSVKKGNNSKLDKVGLALQKHVHSSN